MPADGNDNSEEFNSLLDFYFDELLESYYYNNISFSRHGTEELETAFNSNIRGILRHVCKMLIGQSLLLKSAGSPEDLVWNYDRIFENIVVIRENKYKKINTDFIEKSNISSPYNDFYNNFKKENWAFGVTANYFRIKNKDEIFLMPIIIVIDLKNKNVAGLLFGDLLQNNYNPITKSSHIYFSLLKLYDNFGLSLKRSYILSPPDMKLQEMLDFLILALRHEPLQNEISSRNLDETYKINIRDFLFFNIYNNSNFTKERTIDWKYEKHLKNIQYRSIFISKLRINDIIENVCLRVDQDSIPKLHYDYEIFRQNGIRIKIISHYVIDFKIILETNLIDCYSIKYLIGSPTFLANIKNRKLIWLFRGEILKYRFYTISIMQTEFFFLKPNERIKLMQKHFQFRVGFPCDYRLCQLCNILGGQLKIEIIKFENNLNSVLVMIDENEKIRAYLIINENEELLKNRLINLIKTNEEKKEQYFKIIIEAMNNTLSELIKLAIDCLKRNE